MWWLILIPALVLLLLGILLWVLLPGISTYASRYYCGAVFASGRKPEDIAEDLFFAPLSLANVQVDEKKREVTATVWGLGKRTARYVEGHGIKFVRKGAHLPDPEPEKRERRKINAWPEAIDPELVSYLKPFTQKQEGRTHAVVVLHQGRLIGEVYADGIGPETPLHSWSLTKSLLNALTGILVSQGDLSLEQKPDLPAWHKDGRRHITLRNLLHMDSGLKWKETEKHYLKVSQMLFMQPDVVEFSRKVGLAYDPGTHFAYASCNSNLISGMIRKLFPDDREYHAFPRKQLLDPLGMHHTTLETDAAGNFVGSSFSMGTARDWARFGQLYLNQGRVGDRHLLSPEWIEFSRRPSLASGGKYGAHFWLNASGEHPDLPPDLFYAAGFMGQRVMIFPSHELVVVRMGLGFDAQFNHNRFFSGILKRLP